MEPAKTRDPVFDLVKLIAIAMVIYWHVMSYRPGFDLSSMPSCAANFILALNMPLFFIVSGYFSRRLHESGDWRKLANRLIKYFWPLAFFSFVFAVGESLVTHKYPVSLIPLWMFKKFMFLNWFFFVLAASDFITFLIAQYGRTSIAKILLGILSFATCLMVAGRVWHAWEMVCMMPFYWFGLVLLPKILSYRYALASTACLGTMLMIAITFFLGNIATNGLVFYWDRFDVWHPAMDKALHMVARYIVGGLGSLAFIYGLGRLSEVIPAMRRLAFFGTETFGIYLLQGHVIVHFSNRLLPLNAGAVLMMFASTTVFILCFCMVKVFRRNKLVETLVFGKDMFLYGTRHGVV